MAISRIPQIIEKEWDEWNLRGAVLASLCLQILLIFLSPLRKRAGRYLINIVIWSAYLMANWIAVYAIGVISSSQREQFENTSVNDALAAFWAPFLLLHLGGPDSITAFSLEDNELWIRHLVGLIIELVMVAYVFYQSLPNAFWLPSVLVFVAGAIKYAERSRSLYLACLGNLKDSIMGTKPEAGAKYALLMEEYLSMKEAQLPAEIVTVDEPQRIAGHKFRQESSSTAEAQPVEISVVEIQLKDIKVVQYGYKFYKIFRGLIVERRFSSQERRESRQFFFRLKPEDAFKVMEVELNFMYDELFTKMATVHRGCYGYFFRFTCTVLIVVAFLLFAYHKKPNINIFDIAVTYALLVGAVILDFIALIKLLFSDWTIALLKHTNALGLIYSIHKMISPRSRWSESISQHNLIGYCLKKHFKCLDATIDFFGLKSVYEELWHKHHKHVNEGLNEFIFYELKKKAEKAQGTRAADATSSSWVDMGIIDHDSPLQSVEFSVSKDIEYDQSVLMWHLATDLLYFTIDAADQDEAKSYLDAPCNPRKIFYHCFSLNNPDHQEEAQPDYRKTCKILSDYMLYLLVMRPMLMPEVAGLFQFRLQNTCAEVLKFFHRGQSISERREVCGQLLSVNTEVKPINMKGDRSRSVLFDACFLARDLKSISPDKMWKMMCKVWLDLLCHSASHCRGNAHAQQLSKGGELVTFVWLLMSHFGYGHQFKIEGGPDIVKLIVDWDEERGREGLL